MDIYSENFTRALHAYAGRGGVSMAALAKFTGIKKRTLYAIAAGEFRPNWDDGMAIIREMPEPFANMVLAPTGFAGHRVENVHDDPYKAASALLEVGGDIGRYLEDGVICHVEKAEFRQVLGGTVPILQGYVHGKR